MRFPVVGQQGLGSRNIQKELAMELQCPIISDFTDYIIDEKYFFDSAYHLNDQGVKIRTEKLIGDIEKWISSN